MKYKLKNDKNNNLQKQIFIISMILLFALSGCIKTPASTPSVITEDISPCFIIEPYPEGWTQKQVDKFNAILSTGNVSCKDLVTSKTYKRDSSSANPVNRN